MLNDVAQLRKDLKTKSNPARAIISQKFFKTGKGEYGHGDVFIGVTVPVQRTIASKYLHLSLKDIGTLLDSHIHEERLTAILILVAQFNKGTEKQRKAIYQFYLKKAPRINNWDLVDASAYQIVGAYLNHKNHEVLLKLARSKSLWKRRIAIVACFHTIRQGKKEPTLTVASMLLKDDQELIHKAAGWMLREVGKRVGMDIMEDYLCRNYKKMPRVMLRYSIERLSPERRKAYLQAEI